MAMTKAKPIEGKILPALRPAVSIADDMADAIIKEMGLMARQVKREMLAILNDSDVGVAMDDSPVSRSRIAINRLYDEWRKKFRILSTRISKRMIDQTVKNVNVTLGMSLKEVSQGFNIDMTATNDRIKEIIKASTQSSAYLIKKIPREYLDDVQENVMRAITSGRGQADLVPYFDRKYNSSIKKARFVAMDQHRQAYAAISDARLMAMGITKYVWVHTGGAKEPRQDHIAMSGKEYSLNDPPVIGVMYGNQVRGNPGRIVGCRCLKRPILKFEKNAT